MQLFHFSLTINLQQNPDKGILGFPNNNTSNSTANASASAGALRNRTRGNYSNFNPETALNKNKTTGDLLKLLISEFKRMQQQLEVNLQIQKEIEENIANLTALYQTLLRKTELIDIRAQMQIAMISRKIIMLFEIELMDSLIRLQDKISQTEEELMGIDINIEKYQKTLPNTNSICDQLKNCDECTGNPFCGWCASSGKCVEGNKNGPIISITTYDMLYSPTKKETCKYYDYAKCPHQLTCEKYSNCSECIQDVGCGWCDNLKIGHPMCMSKSDADKGYCARNFFHHMWKEDFELSRCPQVDTINFVNYVDSNLRLEIADESDPKYIVKEYKFPNDDDKSKLNNLLNFTLENKIQEQIFLDRMLKQYNNTQDDLDKLKKEEQKMEESMKLNDTIIYDINEMTLNDINELITAHFKLLNGDHEKEIELINKMFANVTTLMLSQHKLNQTSVKN